MKARLSGWASIALIGSGAGPAAAQSYDVLIENGSIYDGRGGAPFVGEVAIRGDRIVYVGTHAPARDAARRIDAAGLAVAPGFINMLSHSEESLLVDGRGLSDIVQGVTLEVMGESSMGPLSPAMRTAIRRRQGDIRYDVNWTTLDGYLSRLQAGGIAPNVASFVGAGTVRTFVLGEQNVQPSAGQLAAMRKLVRHAMEDGALGVTTALIYTPESYARTPELIALARESARCGGLYIAHIRSEGEHLLDAIDETIAIARASGAPAEIYHIKQAGKANWSKIGAAIARIEAARAGGTRITADMYTYPISATGLDASMPPWVQEGGIEAWVKRLQDPAVRARVVEEMRTPSKDWESAYLASGAEGTRLVGLRTGRLKPLIGKSLAEIGRLRGESPEEAAVDLVVEDGSRTSIAYAEMDEANLRREAATPWISFGSDEAAQAPEGVFLKSGAHPRAYGNFARIFAKYVRRDRALTIEEAVRRLTSLPAETLSITDRGSLEAGAFADIVIFDPATIQDHSTFENPHQLSTGVRDVLVNGRLALEGGRSTGASPGRIVRGRAWRRSPEGGCRRAAADWDWPH